MSRTNMFGPYLFVRAEQVLPEEQTVAEEVRKRRGNKARTQNPPQKKTRELLAEKAGVSPEIIRQVKKILEVISDEMVLNMCRSGEIKVHNAYQLTKLSEQDREEAIRQIREGEDIRAVLEALKTGSLSEDGFIQELMECARTVMGTIGVVWKPGEETPISGNIFADFSQTSRDMEKQLELIGVTEKETSAQWIVVVPTETSTGWFQKICQVSDVLCLVEGRKLAIFYHGTRISAFVDIFGKYGFCL